MTFRPLGFCLLSVCVVLSSCELLGGNSDGGTGGGSGGGAGGGNGGNAGWHAIPLPLGQDDANVMGVYCTAPNKCVVATHSGLGDPGAIFAATDTTLGEKLVDGVYPGPVPTAAHVLGDIDFQGFFANRNGVVARVDSSGAHIFATGDITVKANWQIVDMGRSDGNTLPLNTQAALQVDGAGNWLFINRRGFLYTSPTAPGPSTTWTKVWSPNALPSVPADFATQFAADPTLCDGDVTAGGVPSPSQPNYVSQDLSLIVIPAGGLNQDGTAGAGVCISTDRGVHFYSVPFAELVTNQTRGPRNVTCLDTSRCFALTEAPPAIYTTTNASLGKASTWTRANLPSISGDVTLNAIFFAPDGQHGWVVGDANHHALLLRTTNGGMTWSNVSGQITSVLDHDLYNGFALDADRVWLTGRFGTFVATSTAQQ